MGFIGTVSFVGKSGKQYSFNAYNLPHDIPTEGGIYIFGKYSISQNNIEPIYIGKAKSFENRFYDHHKEDCIKKNGANVICLMNVKDENQRTQFEDDLLKGNPTKCNEIKNPTTPK